MSLQTILAISMSVCITGCASRVLQDYSGSDVTQVEFRSNNGDHLSVAMMSDDLDCYGFKFVKFSEQNPYSKKIAVKEKPYITFLYSFHSAGFNGVMVESSSCGGVFTTPSEGWNIRVDLQGSHKGSCQMRVFKQIKSDPNGVWISAADVVKREQIRPIFDNEGPWCHADSRFEGSSLLSTSRKIAN